MLESDCQAEEREHQAFMRQRYARRRITAPAWYDAMSKECEHGPVGNSFDVADGPGGKVYVRYRCKTCGHEWSELS